jgi:hypothetical protein
VQDIKRAINSVQNELAVSDDTCFVYTMVKIYSL